MKKRNHFRRGPSRIPAMLLAALLLLPGCALPDLVGAKDKTAAEEMQTASSDDTQPEQTAQTQQEDPAWDASDPDSGSDPSGEGASLSFQGTDLWKRAETLYHVYDAQTVQLADFDPLTEDGKEALQAELADAVPAFSASPVVFVNDNAPGFTAADFEPDSFESYSELDSLGRCGQAYAKIGTELMPTEERGEIGQIKPSGWHTIKYDALLKRYLYNRCHLIAYMLTGENDNEQNLITGTRFMNVTGMLPYEELVCGYISSTGNHVLYRVTPIYHEDDLVASGVLIEAASCEDFGADLSFCVYLYNVQPGIQIDYATGESELIDEELAALGSDEDHYRNLYGIGGSETAGSERIPEIEAEPETETKPEPVPETVPESMTEPETVPETEPETVSETEPETEPQVTYILNTNTMKFHYPGCNSVQDMKEKNKADFYGTRDEAIAQGYIPCKRCNP